MLWFQIFFIPVMVIVYIIINYVVKLQQGIQILVRIALQNDKLTYIKPLSTEMKRHNFLDNQLPLSLF